MNDDQIYAILFELKEEMGKLNANHESTIKRIDSTASSVHCHDKRIRHIEQVMLPVYAFILTTLTYIITKVYSAFNK